MAPLNLKVMHINKNYTFNHISKDERFKNIVVSCLLFIYGAYGVWIDDMFVPIPKSKRSLMDIHLHGVPAWIMYGAIICACLIMLSVVVDHYDKRNNERYYVLFADMFKYLGLTLFALSFIVANTS
jgi:hypothetical protein